MAVYSWLLRLVMPERRPLTITLYNPPSGIFKILGILESSESSNVSSRADLATPRASCALTLSVK